MCSQPISNRQLEQLADGELSESQRRAVLSQLDDEPDGWRRCALAFLESQCWEEALGPLAGGRFREASPEAEAALATPAVKRKLRWPALSTLAAMAASFLAALMVGDGLRSWHNTRPSPAEPAAQVADTRPAAPPGIGTPGGDAQRLATPWQMVTVSVPGDEHGKRQSVQLPAIECENIDEEWLGTIPEIPPQVYDTLRRTGHQVHASRQLLPVRLKDGRRLVIPVEQIEVRYQGGGGYQ